MGDYTVTEDTDAKLDELNTKIDTLNKNLKDFLDLIIPLLAEEGEFEIPTGQPPKKNDPAGSMFG